MAYHVKAVSFLDNLENNLKSLESREERDPAQLAAERERKEAEREERLAAAPYARLLRDGAFTQALLAHATRIGFGRRAKVYITWIEDTLRLEARNLRLELRPTGEGIKAHWIADGTQQHVEMVDLNGDAEAIARRWLDGLSNG